MGAFLGYSKGHLIYTGPSPPKIISFADLGETDVIGDLDVEYPKVYEGTLLRLALLAELSLERHYKPLSLQMGIDYNSVSESKANPPLRLSGTGTIVATRETRFVESITEYSYSYNYLSFFFGPIYKIPSVRVPYLDFTLDNFYASAHLRLLLSGSYSLKINGENRRGGVRESSTETGSINKHGLGFGFNFGKRFNWPKNYKTSLNFSYSRDNLDFGGAKYANIFYGLSLGLEF